MFRILFLFFFLPFTVYAQTEAAYIQVLGVTQDGGYPHIGCKKKCCSTAWTSLSYKRYVVSLALVDPGSKRWWLFEATPDIREQLQLFQTLTNGQYKYLPDGIFVTHAHIGHYTGLMQLGREAMSTKDVPIYVMPTMKTYLETNGPWSQLVKLHNIVLRELDTVKPANLSKGLFIETFTVPHRDEYSETAGFRINTGNKKYLFIPDIDKWSKWNKNITNEVKAVDIALLDATFFDSTELPGRNMSEVPHPFVTETMQQFAGNDNSSKIHFIHFNHTNPLLWDMKAYAEFRKKNFNIAIQGQKL